MASSRSKNAPRAPKKIGDMVSVRLTPEQKAKIHALRGDLDLGTYVRNVLDDHHHSPVERAIRDCQEFCAQRGVTPAMLLAAEAPKTK